MDEGSLLHCVQLTIDERLPCPRSLVNFIDLPLPYFVEGRFACTIAQGVNLIEVVLAQGLFQLMLAFLYWG